MGTVQFVDGAILFVGGQIAMHVDCCCEEEPPPCVPCSDPPVGCYQAQPSAVVSVPNGDCVCTSYSGSYEPEVVSSDPGVSCEFRWLEDRGGGLSFRLAVKYIIATGEFWGVLYRAGTVYKRFMLSTDWQLITGLSCNCITGNLEGAFTLNATHAECPACVANITVG